MKVLIASIAAVILVGTGWLWLGGRSDTQYRTLKLERGNIDSAITATGNSNAVVTVQVGSQVSGNIKELYADFNTKVKKGQLVARIDSAIFEAKVTQAQATLDSARSQVANTQSMLRKAEADVAAAQASVDNAKANVAKAQVAVLDAQTKLKRRIAMYDAKLIAAEERDTAQATYDAAVAGVEAAKSEQKAAESNLAAAIAGQDVAHTQLAQAQAQVKQAAATLAQAQVDLDHTYIRAPVDGTVVARRMDVGQTVAASFQAPTLFEIAQDLTRMQVDTNVDEADIGRVRLGQPATFTVDAYPGQPFHGSVVEIRKAPNNVQNVITYDVVVAVPNPDLKLFPGMTANVRILTEHRDNALRLPNAALRFRPVETEHRVHAASPRADGGQTIWVPGQDGKPRPVRVKLGITDGAFSEVVSGDLREGDQVIVGATGKNAAPQTSNFPRRGPGF